MKAFVLGGAKCVWDDYKAARELTKPDIIVLVNHIGMVFPEKAHAWVSYHPELLMNWKVTRAAYGLPDVDEYWTSDWRPDYVRYPVKTVHIQGGSSGMLAAFVALEKADRVVLCGVPMDPEMPHYHNGQQGKPWAEGTIYRKHWATYKDRLLDRVKSMSGWTRELLGEPTPGWLMGQG